MFYGQPCKDLAPADARRFCICFNQCGLVLAHYFFQILMVLKELVLYYPGQCDCTASQREQLTCKFKVHSFWTVRTSGSEKPGFCVLFVFEMPLFFHVCIWDPLALKCCMAGLVNTWLLQTPEDSLFALIKRVWLFLWDPCGSWGGSYRSSRTTATFNFSSCRGQLTSRLKLNVCSVY